MGKKRLKRLDAIEARLGEIAAALNGSDDAPEFDPAAASAFVWEPETGTARPVARVNRVPLDLIRGVDRVRDQLIDNTRRFASGLPANNVLLWGARGMGKSSLVKAAHAACDDGNLKLIEIYREDIETLPRLLGLLAGRQGHWDERFVLFCDDLSFDHDDGSYKSLKAVLEGGVEGRPANVVFYATSNRRHLLPRDMMENERSTAINPGEAVEEKVSLSDRFGLWLGFHRCDQGRLSRHGARLRRPLRPADRGRRAERACARMVGDAGRPVGPRRVAVHHGAGGRARPPARRLAHLVRHT